MEENVTVVHSRSRTIQDYLRMVVRRRWTILAVFITVVSLGAFQAFNATPIYQATVQLLIERHPPKLLDTQQMQPTFDFYGEEFYQTQYKLLESRALAKKVAAKLKLKSRPPYSRMFSQLPDNVDKVTKQRLEENLVSVVAGGVAVSPIPNSSLVNVSYTSPDPKFAAEVANTLAQALI